MDKMTGKDEKGQFTRGNTYSKAHGYRRQISKKLVGDLLESYEQRGGVKYLNELDDHQFVKLMNTIVRRVLPTNINIEDVGADNLKDIIGILKDARAK